MARGKFADGLRLGSHFKDGCVYGTCSLFLIKLKSACFDLYSKNVSVRVCVMNIGTVEYQGIGTELVQI